MNEYDRIQLLFVIACPDWSVVAPFHQAKHSHILSSLFVLLLAGILLCRRLFLPSVEFLAPQYLPLGNATLLADKLPIPANGDW
jgi:hypothetical protein